MKKDNKTKISYEPEADVLRVETSSQPIEYATEIGNVVVHFGPAGIPVYFEILNAKNFITNASLLLNSKASQKSAY